MVLMLKPMRSIFGLLAIATCYAQQGIQIQSGLATNHSSQAPRRTVTGSVVNALSGVPIRHALVMLSGVSPASVLTGADGRFQIENFPEGPTHIFAQKPGFFDASAVNQGFGSSSEGMVTVGADKNDFKVTLFPAARIVGRIIDSEGEAAENIMLQVLGEQFIQGRKMIMPQNSASTDDDGNYRVDGLLPGRYRLLANGHVLPAAAWNAPPEVTAPTYYPDGRDLASAQAIELKPGQETRADFRLHSERGFRISGTFSGNSEKMGVGFSFENASGQSVNFGAVNMDPAKGRWTVEGVPSGTWSVVLSANDGQTNSYEARQEIVVDGADVTDLQFVLHPLATIPIQVTHAASANQPAADPAVVDNALNASLVSTDPFQYRMYGKQAQGTPPVISFANVAPGRYKLSVFPFGSECLESASYGSVDLLRDYLVVGSGEESQPISMSMRSDCATLSLKLQSEDPARQAFVVVVSSSPVAEPYLQPIGNGFSVALTLSPGSYRVFTFSNIEGLEWANAEALTGYPSQSVDLDPGQKTEITVQPTERKGT